MPITAIFNLLLIVVGIIVGIVWLKSIASWDGEVHCKPEDCKTCPYGQGNGFCKYESELRQGKDGE